MSKRHFLMLAHTYVPGAPIGGYYASEKLDGQRAFWDGGITRGMPCSQVPFANTEKHSRYLVEPVATGLWSRYGQPIQAPDWWLDMLPPLCLDGELFLGRNNFQKLISITKTLTGSDWTGVEYRVFDMPAPHIVFGDGIINETNFKKKFVDVLRNIGKPKFPFRGVPQYKIVYEWMQDYLLPNAVLKVHPQQVGNLFEMLEAVVSVGGEGIMLRSPTSIWIPERVRTLLKVKQTLDAEATVVGYTSGRKTELGSKLLGLMGALIVEYNGVRFELSGFDESERVLDSVTSTNYAEQHPGEELPTWIENPKFPRGTKVTFSFRELTDGKVPKEARYKRIRSD